MPTQAPVAGLVVAMLPAHMWTPKTRLACTLATLHAAVAMIGEFITLRSGWIVAFTAAVAAPTSWCVIYIQSIKLCMQSLPHPASRQTVPSASIWLVRNAGSIVLWNSGKGSLTRNTAKSLSHCKRGNSIRNIAPHKKIEKQNLLVPGSWIVILMNKNPRNRSRQSSTCWRKHIQIASRDCVPERIYELILIVKDTLRCCEDLIDWFLFCIIN